MTSSFLNRPAFGRGRLARNWSAAVALGLLTGAGFWLGPILLGSVAFAQNIDEGKNAPQLFAGSCVTCHKSANNLAKGRMTPTLFLFLQDHYTTSKSDAWSLSSYLASVDTSGRSKGTKSSKKRTPRPPAAVPN
jgi:mono/diheme cytochrome c family protein